MTLESKLPSEEDIKVYKTRWIILILYIIAFASSCMQWVLYSIIADTVTLYYGVSDVAVSWTAMIFLLTYAVFCFGGIYLMNKLGLRNSLLLAMTISSVGAWIKVVSVSPDKFWLLMLGQGIVGVSQVFLVPAPSIVAAMWFGPTEVSSACSIGVFGGQLGVALGFVFPPMLINSQENADVIEQGLWRIATITSVANTIALVLLFIFFKAAPPTPPSLAELEKEEVRKQGTSFKQSLKAVLSNSSYMLFIACFAIDIGVFFAIMQLLNQIILMHYPGAAEDAGRIGLIYTITGMIGAVICGIILDRFGKFRETVIAIYALTFVSTLIFTFTLDKGIIIVYVVSAMLGFFMTGLFPTGYELSAELTYPIEESISVGVLIWTVQIVGLAFTYIYGYLLDLLGDKGTNLIMSGCLAIGTIGLFFVKFDLRRRAVQKQDKKNEVTVERF